MENGKTKPEIYIINVPCKDELDLIGSLIFLYSSARVLRGLSPLALRPQLVSLLSLYFKYGYNRDIKEMGADIFNIKIESINSMNLELKEGGYLIEDTMNKRVKHLNKELTTLKNYYEKKGTLDALILTKLFIQENN
jgi:hypothetical protein